MKIQECESHVRFNGSATCLCFLWGEKVPPVGDPGSFIEMYDDFCKTNGGLHLQIITFFDKIVVIDLIEGV